MYIADKFFIWCYSSGDRLVGGNQSRYDTHSSLFFVYTHPPVHLCVCDVYTNLQQDIQQHTQKHTHTHTCSSHNVAAS